MSGKAFAWQGDLDGKTSSSAKPGGDRLIFDQHMLFEVSCACDEAPGHAATRIRTAGRDSRLSAAPESR